MNESISISIQELLLCALLLVAIIALVVLVVLLKRFADATKDLTTSIAKVNELLDQSKGILDDASVIVAEAKDITALAGKTVIKTARTINNAADIFNVNKGRISAVSNLVNATTSLLSLGESKKPPKKKKETKE